MPHSRTARSMRSQLHRTPTRELESFGLVVFRSGVPDSITLVQVLASNPMRSSRKTARDARLKLKATVVNFVVGQSHAGPHRATDSLRFPLRGGKARLKIK